MALGLHSSYILDHRNGLSRDCSLRSGTFSAARHWCAVSSPTFLRRPKGRNQEVTSYMKNNVDAIEWVDVGDASVMNEAVEPTHSADVPVADPLGYWLLSARTDQSLT
ncbi:hypothetical protein EVAR_60900_1 [Eumeta japonica]|uniref:Uncharacterized protein n=1 Tax=Eumeta variegata TaxID=151549 RepID=A0A4C1ZGJ9_EUMVA|nr:hypothetical protein EVAR_60900_1 [Eumeta japonica]